MNAHLLKVVDRSKQTVIREVINRDIAVGHGCCNGVGTSHNAVGHHAMFAATKRLNTINDDAGRTSAANLGTHAVEHVGQVHNLWLACSTLDDRATFSKRCRTHHVGGAQDGRPIGTAQEDGCTLETVTGSNDVAAVHLNLGAELGKTLQMQIDWSRSERTSARHTDHRTSASRQHRPKDADGGAHRLHDLIGSLNARLIAGVQRDGVVITEVNGYPQSLQERPQVLDVSQRADIGQFDPSRGKERCSHQRQSRVFGAFDGDATV